MKVSRKTVVKRSQQRILVWCRCVSFSGGMAFQVHLTLFEDKLVHEEDTLTHLVTYIITGRTLIEHLGGDYGLKLQFRNLLQTSLYSRLWVPPLASRGPSTTTPEPTAVTTIRSRLVGSFFSFVDHVILPYESVAQRDFMLQQLSSLWLKVMGT